MPKVVDRVGKEPALLQLQGTPAVRRSLSASSTWRKWDARSGDNDIIQIDQTGPPRDAGEDYINFLLEGSWRTA
jgi:hypothetical protein